MYLIRTITQDLHIPLFLILQYIWHLHLLFTHKDAAREHKLHSQSTSCTASSSQNIDRLYINLYKNFISFSTLHYRIIAQICQSQPDFTEYLTPPTICGIKLLKKEAV
jgi:hypothetical protein